MKKRIYLLLLSVVLIFSSCKDNDKFTEQLFTNDQITYALRMCIDTCADCALNTLCIIDSGYSYYESGAYRLELPVAAKSVVDTLTLYEYGDAIDTLIYKINRAAEHCGDKMKSKFWAPLVKEITFPAPNALLHGNNTAITDYVKATKQTDFINLLVAVILAEQFKELKVIEAWNELQKNYYNITGDYISIDILTPAAQQMVAGFFKKMATMETAVRKDPNLRGKSDGLFNRVFETL